MNNILVVDDTRDNLQLLSDLLSRQGYDVRPVSNGRRAVSSAQSRVPDLILLDIMMPDMGGYDVCELLKADERTRDVPVIFISALQDTFDKVKAFELGGVDYITKPFQEAEVLARVNTHLTLRRQQQALREEHERFQKLADAAFEGILIQHQGEILEINQTLLTMLGYEYDDLIGTNAFDLLEPHSRDIAAAHLETGDEQPYERQVVKHDGTVVPVEVQGRSIIWQGRTARVLAIRDMSWRNVLEQEQRTLRITLAGREHFGSLVGKSQPMIRVYESILRAAAVDVPVVFYGETGTGKELAARTIVDMSFHHSACFVPVNCASIPENLFESEFFGHHKGAFTGADRGHAGYFEQAQGGTLFLDEVGELPFSMQAKLLRVLEDHTYTPVGANAHRTADVRIIAATNRELRALVRQGKVRSDFFHRLHVLAIDLPPLRDRKNDLPLLIAHFLERQAEAGNPSRLTTLPADMMDRFSCYDWPGNVRELFNELHRYLAVGTVELSGELPCDASDESTSSSASNASAANSEGPSIPDDLPLSAALEHFEQYYITRTFHRQHQHRGNTAEALAVNRKTLYKKLKRYEEQERQDS
ncbi:MAG: sigma-54-dependent Fis family transcriptional regulator [bacterium]|nr:sigma-54-dependent Fis family transcriptional regulator [bacterium]